MHVSVSVWMWKLCDVWANVYSSECVGMLTCIRKWMWVYTCDHECMWICKHVHVWVNVNLWVNVWAWLWVCLCKEICKQVCISLWIRFNVREFFSVFVMNILVNVSELWPVFVYVSMLVCECVQINYMYRCLCEEFATMFVSVWLNVCACECVKILRMSMFMPISKCVSDTGYMRRIWVCEWIYKYVNLHIYVWLSLNLWMHSTEWMCEQVLESGEWVCDQVCASEDDCA